MSVLDEKLKVLKLENEIATLRVEKYIANKDLVEARKRIVDLEAIILRLSETD